MPRGRPRKIKVEEKLDEEGTTSSPRTPKSQRNKVDKPQHDKDETKSKRFKSKSRQSEDVPKSENGKEPDDIPKPVFNLSVHESPEKKEKIEDTPPMTPVKSEKCGTETVSEEDASLSDTSFSDSSPASSDSPIIPSTTNSPTTTSVEINFDETDFTPKSPKTKSPKPRSPRMSYSPGPDKKFDCEVCFKSFAHSQTLKEHYTIHTGERPHQCDICGKSFGHKSHLTRHKRIHTGEKPHICDVCAKAFSQRDALKSHRNIHTREGNFECTVCTSRFTREGYLISHLKKYHSQKESTPKKSNPSPRKASSPRKPKLIEVENATYEPVIPKELKYDVDAPYTTNANESDLKLRNGLDGTQKNQFPDQNSYEVAPEVKEEVTVKKEMDAPDIILPFKCEMCDKSFGRNCHLQRHRKVHLQKFDCRFCHLTFPAKDALKSHLIIHTGEGPYDIQEAKFKARNKTRTPKKQNGNSSKASSNNNNSSNNNVQVNAAPVEDYSAQQTDRNLHQEFLRYHNGGNPQGQYYHREEAYTAQSPPTPQSRPSGRKRKSSIDTSETSNSSNVNETYTLIPQHHQNGYTDEQPMSLSRGALEMFMGVSLSDVEAELGNAVPISYETAGHHPLPDKYSDTIEGFVAHALDPNANHHYISENNGGRNAGSQLNGHHQYYHPSHYQQDHTHGIHQCSYCPYSFPNSDSLTRHVAVHMS